MSYFNDIDFRKVKRGQIYWIEKNPYREAVGSVEQANRPAIIVSNDRNNANSTTFEVVYLTTAPKKDLPTHCVIRSGAKESTALCEQITTISNEQIGNYIGTLSAAEMQMVDTCMACSLGLDAIGYGSIEETPGCHEKSGILELECKLQESQKEAELYKAMYNSLLDRIMNK